MPNNQITAAHEANLPGDELDDIRDHAVALDDSAGSAKELRALLLQALDDLEGAYARINVAYDRLLTDPRPKVGGRRQCLGCGRSGGELTENGCPSCGPSAEIGVPR